MNSPRTTLYRDKQNGKIMGVCAGIADYTGINAFWVRMAVIITLFAGMGVILPAYFIAGFLLTIPVFLRLGGTAFWNRTHGHPDHPPAQYQFSRSNVPTVRRRR